MTLSKLLDILVPRFVTEDVAVKQVGRSSLHEHVSPMKDITPSARYDGVATMCTFKLLGYRLFSKQIGEVRPRVKP